MKFKTWLIAILLFSSQNIYAQLHYVNNDTSNFLKILLVGDLSLNQQIMDASFMKSTNKYDFQHIFHYIRPVLNLGDIVVGNIDNSFGQSKNYLKDGLKNAPSEYGVALKYAGFNLLMNANKSAVYQDLEQWKSNKKFLDDIHITQIGSFEHEQDRYKRNPTVIEKYGIKVAFLNYMEALPFYPEVSPLVNGLREDIVKRDLLLAKNRGADFTIVYMNWGSEFETTENDAQKKLANLCLENGANLVVGCHPNVVQNANVEEDIVNGKITSNIVFYSLGNFVSTSSNPLQNSAAIVEIILEKDKRKNVTFVNDVSYIPTFTAMYDNEGLAQYAIMPVSQVEKNNVTVPINQTEIQWMKGATEQIRQRFNGRVKEIEYELSDAIIDDVAEVLTVTRRPLNEDDEFTLGINKHLLMALSGFMEEDTDYASQPIMHEGVIYKVQFLSLRREIPIDLDYYKHLKGYETYFEGEYYHYVIGEFRNLKLANDFCLDVKRNGHKYAFVVAFENGVKKK